MYLPYSGSIKSHREVNNTLSKLSIKHIKRAQDVWLCNSAAVFFIFFRFVSFLYDFSWFVLFTTYIPYGILTFFSRLFLWIQVDATQLYTKYRVNIFFVYFVSVLLCWFAILCRKNTAVNNPSLDLDKQTRSPVQWTPNTEHWLNPSKNLSHVDVQIISEMLKAKVKST